MGYYFGIIVLASVFLNKFLSELNRNQYIKFILVIFAGTQFSWIGGGAKFFGWRSLRRRV